MAMDFEIVWCSGQRALAGGEGGARAAHSEELKNLTLSTLSSESTALLPATVQGGHRHSSASTRGARVRLVYTARGF